MMSYHKLVILDKNFLQAENRDTPRLCALARLGCEFVLPDTLVYEICSDLEIETLWKPVQKKLFPFTDRVRCWFHIAELLRQEVKNKVPVNRPEDWETTQRLRTQLRSGQPDMPCNLKKITKVAHRQREVDTMAVVAPMACAVGKKIDDEYCQSRLSKNDRVLKVLDDPRWMQWMINASFGDAKSDNYIPNAADRINETWFAFHYARATLALCLIYYQNYGVASFPSKKFSNSILDSDYLMLLHYADAIASDETSGDMVKMYRWLFDSRKKYISSKQLNAIMPNEDNLRLKAYFTWEQGGRIHGHDLDDWLVAERELMAKAWEQL